MLNPYKTTGSEELRFNCPRCSDTNFHLYYNPRKSVFHCFRCNYSGYGYPPELSSLVLPPVPQSYTEKKRQRVFNWRPLDYPSQSVMEAVIWDYLLNSRKLTVELVLKYNLGWSEEVPFAVAIPIMMRGKLQGLQVRYLTKSFAKYVFYPIDPEQSLRKSTLLFNYDQVAAGVETLYVMEGPFDVLCSEPGCSVCTFGMHISTSQALLINKIPKRRLVLAFDPEVKISELHKSVEALEAFEPVFIKWLPLGSDPGDLGSQFVSCPEFTFLDYIVERGINHATP